MILFPPATLQQMADLLAQTFRDQIEAGLDETGAPFPVGIDLYKTGALLNSIKGVVVDGEPTVEVGVPYAPYVLGNYKSTALCPQYQQILITRWQPLMSQAQWVSP